MRNIITRLLLSISLSCCISAYSNTFTVTSTTDYTPGKYQAGKISGMCLRKAIEQAKDGDVILFDLPKTNLNEPQTITITSEQDITQGFTLDGGVEGIIIQVENQVTSNHRVFNVDLSSSQHPFTLINMTLKGGNISATFDSGGSIFIIGTSIVNMTNVTVQGSTAENGGGIYIGAESTANINGGMVDSCTATGVYPGAAGGIRCDGNLTIAKNGLTGTIISNNKGSGITFSYDNVHSVDSARITGATISENTLGSDGGGIHIEGRDSFIADCIIENNTAAWGGGIQNTDGQYHILGTLTVTNSIIRANTATGGNPGQPSMGGGIFNLCIANIDGCTIGGTTVADSNRVVEGYGGGIGNIGTMTISNSTISNNSVTGTPFDIGKGGGIANASATGTDPAYIGSLTVTNCTISSNTAEFEGGGIGSTRWNGGTPILNVTNSTISENKTTGAEGVGAGIQSDMTNTTINSCTIIKNQNELTFYIAGLDDSYGDPDGSLTISNTIIAGNLNTDLGGWVDLRVFNNSPQRFFDNGYNVGGRSGVGGSDYTWGATGDWYGTDGIVGDFLRVNPPTPLPGGLYLDSALAVNGALNNVKTYAITNPTASKLYSIPYAAGGNTWNHTPPTDEREIARTFVEEIDRAIGAYDASVPPGVLSGQKPSTKKP